MRVKVCGVTRPGDARLACSLGAWAIGMILSPRGPRALTVEAARAVRDAIAPGVFAIGVVVDEPVERVNELARLLRLDLVQLHGRSEEPRLIEELAVPAIKAFGVDVAAGRAPALEELRRWGGAWGALLDARVGGRDGGTGRAFDWSVVSEEEVRAAAPAGRLLLAGGLNPENVREASERVRPFALDVASGVESAPGVKDPRLLERVFAAVA